MGTNDLQASKDNSLNETVSTDVKVNETKGNLGMKTDRRFGRRLSEFLLVLCLTYLTM